MPVKTSLRRQTGAAQRIPSPSLPSPPSFFYSNIHMRVVCLSKFRARVCKSTAEKARDLVVDYCWAFY